MTSQQATNALKLLERVQLTGPESMVWVDVCNALREIAEPKMNGKDETESETRADPGAA